MGNKVRLDLFNRSLDSVEKMLFYTNIFVALFTYAIYRYSADNPDKNQVLFEPQMLTFFFTQYGIRISSTAVAWYLMLSCLISTGTLSIVLKVTKL